VAVVPFVLARFVAPREATFASVSAMTAYFTWKTYVARA